MSRDLTEAFKAELAKQRVRPVVFVQAEFVSAVEYLWSGIGSIVWNGQTWKGMGNLGSISPIDEAADVYAQGIKIGLSGIPSDMLAKALGEVRQNAPVKVWFGFLDEAEAVIADPYCCFSGRMDAVEISEGGETSTISIAVENRLRDLGRPRERRWTHEDQQIDFPGDLGFQYVASAQDWDGVWGKPGPTTPNVASPTQPSYEPPPGGYGGPSYPSGGYYHG